MITLCTCLAFDAVDSYRYKSISFLHAIYMILVPMAARSMMRVCVRSLAGIAGSNPTDVYMLCVYCVVR